MPAVGALARVVSSHVERSAMGFANAFEHKTPARRPRRLAGVVEGHHVAGTHSFRFRRERSKQARACYQKPVAGLKSGLHALARDGEASQHRAATQAWHVVEGRVWGLGSFLG